MDVLQTLIDYILIVELQITQHSPASAGAPCTERTTVKATAGKLESDAVQSADAS